MYGLLLENLSEYVKTVFGEEKWDEIRKKAGISAPSFGVHEDYDEELLNHLAKTAQQVSFSSRSASMSLSSSAHGVILRKRSRRDDKSYNPAGILA